MSSEDASIVFDMDDTLFDYTGQLKFDLFKLQNPTEEIDIMQCNNLWELENQHKWLKRRINLIRRVPGWWQNLPKFQLGWDIFWMAKSMNWPSMGILTKGPASTTHSWAEKVECIRQNPDLCDLTIHLTEDKGSVYSRVLVDDYPEYIKAWLKYRPRGLAIMPAHEHNKIFVHENVIRYDGCNQGEVTRALRAAKDRQSCQHWKDLL